MVVGPRGEARAVSLRHQAMGYPGYPRYPRYQALLYPRYQALLYPRYQALLYPRYQALLYPRYQALLGNVRFRSSASRGTGFAGHWGS
jgi:hypothetical protein